MSDIQFQCPHCGGSLAVDEAGAGLQVPCPLCAKAIVIPQRVIPTPIAAVGPERTNAPALCVVSLVLGIVSITCLGWLAAVPAVVLGLIGLRQANAGSPQSAGRGLAIAGMTTAIVGAVLWTILFLLIFSTDEGAATKAAWDRMCEIEVSLRAYRNDSLEYWDQCVRQYSTINTDGIDKDLRQFLLDYIHHCDRTHSLLEAFDQEARKISQGVDDAAAFGALLGSTDQYDPQGSAVGGALLFGLLGAVGADAQSQELCRRYEPQFNQLQNEYRELLRRQDELADKLAKKYKKPFNRKI